MELSMLTDRTKAEFQAWLEKNHAEMVGRYRDYRLNCDYDYITGLTDDGPMDFQQYALEYFMHAV